MNSSPLCPTRFWSFTPNEAGTSSEFQSWLTAGVFHKDSQQRVRAMRDFDYGLIEGTLIRLMVEAKIKARLEEICDRQKRSEVFLIFGG